MLLLRKTRRVCEGEVEDEESMGEEEKQERAISKRRVTKRTKMTGKKTMR